MGTVVQLHSAPSAQPEGGLRGHLEARVFTPPLRELTPETSYGFAVIDFARDVLEEPLDPWQEWLVIRAGELLPDGRPRFRKVLILVARQNGKTHLLKVLSLFWLFVEEWDLILGMSTNIDYAKESWEKAVLHAQRIPELDAEIGKSRGDKGIKYAAGMQEMRTQSGSRYKIAASNRLGGRSLSIDRLVVDELCQQHDFSAYNASYPALAARPFGQAWFITNQGDSRAVVLDDIHKAAKSFIDTGEGDHRTGLFEWSAEDGCDVMDEEGWAAANPNLGHRRDYDDIRSEAIKARDNGGESEAGFRTELLCQRVKNLDPAVNPEAWDKGKAEFTPPKDRRVGVIDIPRNMSRATFAVARMTPSGKVQLWAAKDWTGPDALKRMRAELPGVAKTWGIRKLGFMPIGPAAAVLPAMQKSRAIQWPTGLEIEAITAEVPALCMGFSEQVTAGEVEHQGQELLDFQVKAAGKRWIGKRWEFDWTKDIPLDAAFAAAGAVHLARMLPAPLGPMRLIGPDDD